VLCGAGLSWSGSNLFEDVGVEYDEDDDAAELDATSPEPMIFLTLATCVIFKIRL
jgi:hypothetical protein